MIFILRLATINLRIFSNLVIKNLKKELISEVFLVHKNGRDVKRCVMGVNLYV